MNHKQIIQEMKDSIGTKDPLIYFDKLTDCLSFLFEKIEKQEVENEKLKMLSALAIQWDDKVAGKLLSNKIFELRLHKDVYFKEISALKQAYSENIITQDYDIFCEFWEDTLGWHPFMGS